MDIDQSSSGTDEDSVNHINRYFAFSQHISDTQKSIEDSLRDQNSIIPQAAKELGNSVEDFVWACHTFKTAGSAAIRNQEGSHELGEGTHELRGGAVKRMLSEWMAEITRKTKTLTAPSTDAASIDPGIDSLLKEQRRALKKLNKSVQILADPWGHKVKMQAKELKTLLNGEVLTRLLLSKRPARMDEPTFLELHARAETLVDETNALVSGDPKYANDSPWPQSDFPEGLPPPTDTSMFDAYEKDTKDVRSQLKTFAENLDYSSLFNSETVRTATKEALDLVQKSINELSDLQKHHLADMHGIPI
jgi:hypothetical protein